MHATYSLKISVFLDRNFQSNLQKDSLPNVERDIPLHDLQQSLLTEEYFGQYPALTQLWHGFPGLSVQTGGLVGWTPSIKKQMYWKNNFSS